MKRMFKLDQTTIKKLLTTYKLKIPDFQRSFVWKKPKKQQLIKSLLSGFPIGAITLYEDVDFYYIIDGLQRINTLNQYLSQPSKIIGFNEYYKEIEDELNIFYNKQGIVVSKNVIKQSIKLWYENLEKLYEFEKISVFNKYLQADEKLSKYFNDLELIEEFLNILIQNISIYDQDIAIIIYSGEKDTLPELFKNINTGSVALSKYEILQSVWADYYLDKNILECTYNGFSRELDIIKNDYEIDAIKESGEFDIFKNMIGLNNIICSKKESNKLFTLWKKIEPIKIDDHTKYYDNEDVAFEILSTIICYTSNKIVKAVDDIFSIEHNSQNKTELTSEFINKINYIIIEAIDKAISEIEKSQVTISGSKYHSLYIIAGLIFSKYSIDLERLEIIEKEINNDILEQTLNFKVQMDKKWFIDENRQLGFFSRKIKELIDVRG